MMKSNWMKRGIVSCILGVGLWGSASLFSFSDEEKKYAPDELLVRYKPGVSSAQIRQLRKAIHAERLEKFSINDVQHYKLEAGQSLQEALSELKGSSKVLYAEPNYVVELNQTPNDPDFSKLYGMNNTGQTGGTADADIDAPEAWNTQTGNQNLVIAIIDTGVDYNHPDLAANIWTNPKEIAGNGIDDDGNGYVDDIHGWDFYNKDADPMDDHYHGTHVAGTIAGVGNNGIGVTGVVWKAKIMALKFLSSGGSGYTSGAISAINYATQMGAKISNNSWGGGGYSQALKDAITANQNAGALFVAAAGNSGVNADTSPMYPAAYDVANIISVAATDAKDQLASFSNYGKTSVDLGAPGVSIYSTAPNNTYKTLSGTSMATPHVAGAVALIWSQFPSLTNLQVKDKLLVSTDPISALSGKTVSGGRLNINNFMENDTTAPAPVTNLATSSVSYFTTTLTWTATGDDGFTGQASTYDLRYSTSAITESNFSSALQASGLPSPKTSGQTETFKVTGLSSNTAYYFALKVKDNVGNTSSLSNVISATTSQGTTFYQDNFENGQGSWVTGGTNGTGGGTLWHLSTRKSNSATHSFYYGSESKGNYNTGQANYGWITSPKIYLTSATNSTLIFNHYLTTENLAPYDEGSVRISTDGGSTFTTLNKFYSTSSKWQQVSVDLSKYDGKTVYIQFYFTTLDALYNSYEGWYVDDVQVMADGQGDTTPPAAISNLAISSLGQYSLTLNWTATGDDGNTGTASFYDLRYSTSTITDSNFSSAVQVSGLSSPKAAGNSESFEVKNLSSGVTYYFAIKATDDLSNTSAISNGVNGKTKTGPKISVSPSTLAKVSLDVGKSTTQSLTIQNTGDENLTFDITEIPTTTASSAESSSSLETGSSASAAYAPSQILVKFKEGLSEAAIHGLGDSVDARTVKIYSDIDVHLIETASGLDAQEMARMYLASGLVEYAEPNYVVQALSTFPNDSSFSQLYGLHNTGQTGGTADADIDAPEAWDTTKGASSVVVAVIDTGVDYTHPDLSANMWTNSGEIPNNGLDDDGDGYVDDYRGWDFVNEDNDPMDDNKHGTHVSGTIGGVGNNGTGVAGVCWNVKIMPLKFLSGSGSGYTSDAVEAVLYANKKGANVMSNSWGGGGYSQALYDAIKAAEVKGILFVAAAGNSSSNNDQVANYPSNYNISNVIAVAATDANDALAWFSNYGANTVHLGAPGVSIYSTLPGNTYGSLSGTSMATPHVAGACALVWSANPSWNYAKVKNQIMVGTDKISSMSGKTVSGGRLNVYKALQAAETTPPSAVTDLSSSMVSFSTLKLKWTATGDDGNTGTATSYEIRYSTSSITSSNFSSATLISNTPTPKSAGGAEEFNVTGLSQKTTYYFAMKVTDDASNTSGLSNVTSATTDEAVVTYLDSMETGAGWTVTGLWHLSTRKSNSPTHSFYYGDETKGNYDTGSTTQGTLTSSTIDLSSGVTPQLSFQYWRKVESGGIYDKTYLEISKDNGSNWTQLWYKNSSNTSEQAWTSSGPLDLSSYKGAKVLLRFTFDSVDAYLNFYEGFYVDDVQILDSKTDFNWLSVQPATGTLTANQSSTVTLTYTAVSSGTYKGAILIKSNDPAKPSTTLSLELTATQDTTAPSAISNLKVASIASSNTSLTLTWTAPGDDDNVGTASSYEIRYSTSLITDANFSAATLAPNPPTPQVAGSTETFSLTGLALSQNYYYVAIKTQDDVGQVSSLSNVVKTSDLDSDGDGLCDQDEYSMGTDPLKSDTDSDGFSDGQEKSIGTDPVKSTDFPATIILTCDNAYEIYINGVFKGNDSNWTNKETYYAKLGDTIAIKGIDLGGIASLLCQISHGNKIMPSNFLWKASPQAASGWTNPNFDDSSWPGAVEHFAYGHGPWEQWVNGFDASNNWIWTNRPEEHDTVYFRRKVDFSQNALLRVTADNAFEAWLDGQYLGSSNVWHLPKFFIGTVSEGSLIALHGIDLGGIGGLLASLTYVDSNGKRQMVGTNSSWKISTTSSSGWQNTGFDENSWSSATEWAAFGSGVWGSFDMGAHFSNASQAKWIWASDPYSIDDIYARKTILTPNATLSMTADNKFKVYHNGNLVASSSQWWSPAVVGLNNLQNGDVIAVRADDEGGIAAFLAKLDFNGTQIFSNTTWKASTGPFWEADLSWTSKSYDDSNWTSAFPVGGNGISPWGYLSDCGSAQWIWASSDTDGVNTSFFRWTVGTNNTEVGVTSFLVSADNEYKFYKNGVLITSGSRWYMPESFTCLLSPGDVIAIEARDYGYKAGLLLYASGAYNLVSDSSWKMSTTEQSGGWASKTFDDSGWASASDHGAYGIAPWGSNASGFPTSSSARWIWGPNNQTGATNIDSHVFFRKKIA